MNKTTLISLLLLIPLISCSDMKTISQSLVVNKIFVKDSISFESVSEALEENTKLNKVDWLEWKEYSYKPQVSFMQGNLIFCFHLALFGKPKKGGEKPFTNAIACSRNGIIMLL